MQHSCLEVPRGHEYSACAHTSGRDILKVFSFVSKPRSALVGDALQLVTGQQT